MNVAVAVAILCATAAHTAPPERDAARAEAMELSKRGQRAYRLRHYSQAARFFARAHEAFASPKLLYNLAMAHEKAGDFLACADALTRYLSSPKADGKRATRRWLARVERRIARSGGRPSVQPPAAAAPIALAAVTRSPLRSVARGRRSSEPVLVRALEPGPDWLAPTGWSALGVGVLTAAAGFSIHMSLVDRGLDLADRDVSADASYREDFDELDRDRASLEPMYAALYGVGGALIAAGIVFLIVDDSSDDLWVAPAAAGAGVVLGGSF